MLQDTKPGESGGPLGPPSYHASPGPEAVRFDSDLPQENIRGYPGNTRADWKSRTP